MPDVKRKIGTALLSVSDKRGLVDFATVLAGLGVELISTGGTRQNLSDAGLDVRDISDITGFPELLDGRLKTLHPVVHGGLLAVRDNLKHTDAMKQHGIAPIDLAVINLYPFEETVAFDAAFEACIENIDIGGPAMIRSAAKNHDAVAIVTDIDDYEATAAELTANDGALPHDTRRQLAAKAFAHTASYDAAISAWFSRQIGDEAPGRKVFAGRLLQQLRYGENPHQKAAFYQTEQRRPGVATATQAQGKELSYNNINDTDAAFECVCEFDPQSTAAVAIIKHANPCGVARGETLVDAYGKALECDPVSAYGGIVALNREIDGPTADKIVQVFTEVIIAPDADEDARQIIANKPNLRLLLTGQAADPTISGDSVKSVAGGFLVQTADARSFDDSALKVVTKRAPSKQELADLKFAFTVCKHVKSNAVVYAKNGATVGVGAGQMSRIDASRIAAMKARDAAHHAGRDQPLTIGSVVASDAFFPFADGLLQAAEAGATAVIQPGGSIRDDEVIQAADDAGLAMIFTGIRHFRH